MTKEMAIKLFEQKEIRSVWSEVDEKWYFSIVDILAILTDQEDFQRARKYWKVVKNRLVKKGTETVTIYNGLKLLSYDGNAPLGAKYR